MFGKNKRPPAAALAGGLVALLALAGCAGGMEKPHAVPARPIPSMSVPTGQPAKTLSPDALDAPAATSVAAAQRPADHGGGHEGHGGHSGTYVHTDAGRETAAQEEPHDHHGHAEAYACPMHPEVTSETAGKCPKCGMDLVKRRKE